MQQNNGQSCTYRLLAHKDTDDPQDRAQQDQSKRTKRKDRRQHISREEGKRCGEVKIIPLLDQTNAKQCDDPPQKHRFRRFHEIRPPCGWCDVLCSPGKEKRAQYALLSDTYESSKRDTSCCEIRKVSGGDNEEIRHFEAENDKMVYHETHIKQ